MWKKTPNNQITYLILRCNLFEEETKSVLKCYTLREAIYLFIFIASFLINIFSIFLPAINYHNICQSQQLLMILTECSYRTCRDTVCYSLLFQGAGTEWILSKWTHGREQRRKERRKTMGISSEIKLNLHPDLPQAPGGTALRLEWFCHTNISWTHFEK